MKFFRRHKDNETPDERKVRSISFWHFLLIAFIVLWMAGAYLYLDSKANLKVVRPPVVVLDSSSGVDLTNLFKIGTNAPLFTKPPLPHFEIKKSYAFGDVVVVKFFYIEAVVLEKSTVGDNYTIIYKDHSHVLQKITLPKELLLSPSSGVLHPASLLVD